MAIANGEQYESFWQDPSSVSFIWISILFSLLYFGSMIDQHSSTIKAANPSINADFIVKAGQALVTGEYAKAKPYSVEALFLYAFAKYLRKEETDAFMLMSMSTRLAMKMGYHRDPRHFPSISPFEGEMRRRTFATLETFDLLESFHAGVPSIIHEEECDIEPPGNLLDTDFGEDCTTLPPSRPENDATPMLYSCWKTKVSKTFRRVVRYALSSRPPSHDTTRRLDKELRDLYDTLPDSLKLKTIGSSFTDEAVTTLKRLNIALVYHESLCVLHRRYLSFGRSDSNYDSLRETCVNAAMQILRYQIELHEACQPGRRFHADSWVFSGIRMNSFLLAAMIICIDLYELRKAKTNVSPGGLVQRNDQIETLKSCQRIWSSQGTASHEARRASRIVEVMLSNVLKADLTGNPLVGTEAALITPESSPQTTSSVGNPPPQAALPTSGTDVSVQLDNAALDMAFDPLSAVSLPLNGLDDYNWVCGKAKPPGSKLIG